jgi:hypothetical protein
MVAILATIGRFSLSTTALALIDLNVSEANCTTNASREIILQGCRFQRTALRILLLAGARL